MRVILPSAMISVLACIVWSILTTFVHFLSIHHPRYHSLVVKLSGDLSILVTVFSECKFSIVLQRTRA